MNIELFCSDLDGTLLGDHKALQSFGEKWKEYGQKGILLCYNTGRTVQNVLSLVGLGTLPPPDFIIGSVGTEIFDWTKQVYCERFQAKLFHGWNREVVTNLVVNFPQLVMQPEEFQNPFKSSWFLENANSQTLEVIAQRLRKARMDAQIIYSGARFLDIIPRQAGKGNALAWALDEWNISQKNTVVAGDSSNDKDMFNLPYVHRVAVANSEEDFLRSLAEKPLFRSPAEYATGVLQGLAYFNDL